LYDAGGNLLAEATEDGEIIREYLYLDGRRLTLFDYSVMPEFTVRVVTSAGVAVSNVRSYAFTDNNSYAGIYGVTDEQGVALYSRGEFGEGSYTFRIDCLGANFWSEPVTVQSAGAVTVVIEDEPVAVQVLMAETPQAGVKVYVFNESGSYMGISGLTDAEGRVSFQLPEGENYTFSADLLGGRYWSSVIAVAAGGAVATIDSGGGELLLTVGKDEQTPLPGIKTYLFSATGSYLGQSRSSDAGGRVAYAVPDGSFKVRVDYLGRQYWLGDQIWLHSIQGCLQE
jgi:hypothetical protein